MSNLQQKPNSLLALMGGLFKKPEEKEMFVGEKIVQIEFSENDGLEYICFKTNTGRFLKAGDPGFDIQKYVISESEISLMVEVCWQGIDHAVRDL